MSKRIDFYTGSKEAISAMVAFEKAVASLPLEPALLELVRLRASQINGCAFCVDMHTSDARKTGEAERRLYAVSVWREAQFFSERERAALAWTEAPTNVATTRAPDADYELLAAHFNGKEMADLTLAIVAIDGWNRFGVGFRFRKMSAISA